MKEKTLYINDMHCANCQTKIENVLKNLNGVASVNVSYQEELANIVYDENLISLDIITKSIEDLDYKVSFDRKKFDLLTSICISLIVTSLYIILQKLNILNKLAPTQLADTSMSYGMLFVIGLITSIHCVAMCGGINLSQSINQKKGIVSAFKYNFSRVISYTVIGFVLGLIGSIFVSINNIGISSLIQGFFKILAGVFMVYLGITSLDIFPNIKKISLKFPNISTRFKSNQPYIVGLLNGLMPCGALQSMWIVALVSGNAITGALSMLMFGLGTVPLMLGLSSIISILGKKFSKIILNVGNLLVTILGFAMLSQGVNLSGLISNSLLLCLIILFFIMNIILSLDYKTILLKNIVKVLSLCVIVLCCIVGNFFKNHADEENIIKSQVVGDTQMVYSTLQSGEYPTIEVKANIPVKWIINAQDGTINGCNYKLIINDFNLEYSFSNGENVIEFLPTDVGNIQYSCWMGMILGNIIVVE